MKALVYTAPGVVEVDDMPEPRVSDGEVLVEVERAGICGSELHGIREPGFRVPPLIMGHEFAGRTADGRRVVVNPLVVCGTCDHCLGGKPQLCRTRLLLGVHRAGGFAERVAVPAGAMHELPGSMSWEAAALIEPLANAVHAWNLVGGPSGRRVGIIGCGTIGLVCLEVARAKGASYLAASDLSPERRVAAERLGAHSVGEALTGELDVVVDAVGVAATRAAAIDQLTSGGTAIWIGLASAEAGVDAQAVVRTEKRIMGSFGYSDEEFAEAISLVDKLDLSFVETFSLAEDGATIFNELMNGRALPIKALLAP